MAIRRILALLCCSVIAAATLAGCGALTTSAEVEPPPDPRLSGEVTPEAQLVEPALEHAVFSALGEKIEVRCWSEEDWHVVAEGAATANGLPNTDSVLGIAQDGPQRIILLSPRVCGPLAVLARGEPVPAGTPALDLAQALVTVGHEAGHLVSDLDTEASAECFGAQHVSDVAQALGTTEIEGRQLADLYWNWVYPMIDPIYRTAACHDGGPLDLNPLSSVWP